MCKCYTDPHPVSSRARERQKHRERVSVDALVFALQLMSKEQPGPQKAQHPSKDCEYEQERSVHNIAQLLPGVGTYYNPGTALYYAAQNCSE